LARGELAGLSLEEKCGQLLLIGVAGSSLANASDLALVRDLGPGGVLLFGFNTSEGPAALASLVGAYQDASARSGGGLPLVVAIDHEGGTVFRFKTGLTRLPSAAAVGQRGPGYAGLLGEVAGRELLAIGINLALAPVVEELSKDNAEFLGTRSYGEDARRVDACAGAFIEGLARHGVAAAAKHFPGNGSSDPHRGSPRLDASAAALERDYISRFRSAIRHGSAVVLLSHVVVTALDPLSPATLSRGIVEGRLKRSLRFDGVALTDDLFMRAVSGHSTPEKTAVLAVAAGADLLMLSEGQSGRRVRQALVAAVEGGVLAQSRVDDAVLRILELKARFHMEEGLDPALRRARLARLPAIVADNARLLEAWR
jgi:beta-N-acetylhexosaminidase